MTQDLLVVVNAAAGTAREAQVAAAADALREAAASVGAGVDVVMTADLAELDSTLSSLGDRRLVVMGGDGSVHAAVQSLHAGGRLRAAGPIGVVPLGTGNDLAGTLGLSADPEEAARTVVAGTARPMSLLVADDGEVAVNAVHVGVAAAAAREGSSLKRRLGGTGLGRLAYRVGGLVTALTDPGRRLRVEVDGSVFHQGHDPVLLVALGVGPTVGGGAPLVPGADPHDGSVEVVVSTAVGPMARVVQAVEVGVGLHVRRPDVRTARGRVVEVHAAPGELFRSDTDGEVRGPFTHRRWALEAAAWQVLVQSPSRR